MTSVTDNPQTTSESPQPEASQPKPEAPLRIRYRIRFSKTDLLRWISHRDLARLWERLIRRAQLKPSMTEGFHPKPRIGFPSALALGVESLDEVVELDLAEEPTPEELLRTLADDEQPGLNIISVAKLPEGFGKAQLTQSDYVITVAEGYDVAAIQSAIDELMSQETVTVERKKKPLVVDPKVQISSLLPDGDHLLLSLAASDGASLKPTDVLDLLGFNDWIENGSLITRTRVHLQREPETNDPATFVAAADLSPQESSNQSTGGDQ
jgi:radical SAM-linked protein